MGRKHQAEISLASGYHMKETHMTTSNILTAELVRRADSEHGDSTIERLVLQYGTHFNGIDRPKGMRLGPAKNCFWNSYNGAGKHDGVLYVEGFAMVRGYPPIHHAWISLDGIQAIDLTLRDRASETEFYGIPFSISLATEELMANGATLPLFSLSKPISHLHALAEKAGSGFEKRPSASR